MSKNNIPKVIMQTGSHKNYNSPNKDRIIAMNPGYKYEYYNDNDCIAFIRRHFSEHVAFAFKGLKPGAFKADLFRYCYIYAKGGIYIDLDLMPIRSLDEILNHDVNFISCRENIMIHPDLNGIYQAFMAGEKHLEFLKVAITKIVNNVYNKYYPSNHCDIESRVLSVTGPVLLYDSMNLKSKLPLGYCKTDHGNIFLYDYFNDIYDLNKNKMFVNGIYTSSFGTYSSMFTNKDIYH